MQDFQKQNISGYILAGGKSSRMGEDKGLMLFNGKPVVQYVIDALMPAVNTIIIVSNNPAYASFGFKVIADEIKNIGPAGGIFTALNHSDSPANFIVSCDMPFVTSDAIEYMITQATGSQIALAVNKGQMEPLFGVYKKDCVKEWYALIEHGIIKLQDMVSYFNLEKVNMDKQFNDSLFLNINTREDLENALTQI